MSESEQWNKKQQLSDSYQLYSPIFGSKKPPKTMNSWWISIITGLGIQRLDSIIFVDHHQKSGSHLSTVISPRKHGDAMGFSHHLDTTSGFLANNMIQYVPKMGEKLTNKNRIQCEMHRIEMYIIKNILYLGKWLYWLYIWLYIYTYVFVLDDWFSLNVYV